MAATAFDKLARSYDEQWTRSPVGRLQRDAVWRHIEGLFPRGGTVLDLGCGTGEDALHLMNGGIRVEAVDSSSEMVRVARERGVDARTLSIEDVGALDARFDGRFLISALSTASKTCRCYAAHWPGSSVPAVPSRFAQWGASACGKPLIIC